MTHKRPFAFAASTALVIAALAAAWFLWSNGQHPAPLADGGPPEDLAADVAGPSTEPRPAASRRTIATKPHGGAENAPFSDELAGIVVDQNGSPVEAARCELREDASFLKDRVREGALVSEAATTAEGLFLFERSALAGAESYVLKVTHPAYAAARRLVGFTSFGGPYVRVTLAQGTAISGTVTHVDGSPVPNATVSIVDSNHESTDPAGPAEAAATTDAAGRYRIRNASPGSKRVSAAADGLATAARQLALEGGRPADGVDLVLGEGAAISGRVLARDTGAAIGGAWVVARAGGAAPQPMTAERKRALSDRGEQRPDAGVPAGRERSQRPGSPAQPTPNPAGSVLTVRSNADGTYALAGAEAARSYAVSAHVPGWGVPLQQVVAAPAGAVDFALAPSARILGRVVDAETGKPVPSFSLGLVGSHDSVIPRGARASFGPPKSTDGRFEYLDVPAGRHWLLARAAGYAGGRSTEVVIAEGERKEGIEIRLVRGSTVRGRVVDGAGRPVPGATVAATAPAPPAGGGFEPMILLFTQSMRQDLPEARTDARGEFELGRLLDGSYALAVTHPDFASHTAPPFEAPAFGEVAHPDVVLALGATIRGRVRMPDGTPDTNAEVQVLTIGSMRSRSAPTDSDGRYEIRGLPPGSYRVLAPRRAGAFDFGAVLAGQKAPVHVLGEGEVKEIDF